jgi:ATP-dependent RNA helicase RhlE
MKFTDLGLIEPILRAIAAEGYVTATPVQAQSIPHILDGKDVMGSAQTGTGKTAAFALPILHRLSQTKSTTRQARCLVLCPTRELAIQIGDSFRVYGKNLSLRHAVIFGGVNQHGQTDALRGGVDIIVATPGRLMDLMQQRLCDLRGIEILVLDEADRMLDMGFIHDIRKIVSHLRAQKQTLLFSATMPNEIRRLATDLLQKPAIVQVAPVTKTTEQIEETVYFVEKHNKATLLANLFNDLPMARALVFTRTKHGADRVVRHLHTRGIHAEAIHGNKTQNARKRALENFRNAKTPVLVATDIASRGIDIDNITHVVNYDLTHEPETYVHRIGRTGRAGATGAAVSFCDPEERANLVAIQALIRRTIPVKNHHVNSPSNKTAAPKSAPHHNARAATKRPPASQHKHSERRAHPIFGNAREHRRHSYSGGRAR